MGPFQLGLGLRRGNREKGAGGERGKSIVQLHGQSSLELWGAIESCVI